MRWKPFPRIAVVALFTLLPMRTASAVTIDVAEEAFIELHGFAQTAVSMTFAESEAQPTVVTDLFLRRVRLLVSGQLNRTFRFFIGTLNSDFGKGNEYGTRPLLGDVRMEIVLADEAQIALGLLKLPFSRHGGEASGSLHGIDFHGAFLAHSSSAPPHRDIGVMVRGLLIDGLIDYRVAIVDGREPTGDKDWPRFVGRVGFNVFDAEPGYFFSGTYLGTKQILAFGVSFDLQPGVGGHDGSSLAWALAFDAFADIPFDEHGLVATVCAYLHGPGRVVPEGFGMWADVGFRVAVIEPLVAVEWFQPSEGDSGKRLAILPGVNWWIVGHKASLKLRFGAARLDGAGWSEELLLQAQIGF